MTTKTVEEVLLRAAEIVEERWQQGAPGKEGGPRSITGALREVVGHEAFCRGDDKLFRAASSAVYSVVGCRRFELHSWNDAPERTKEEVAAKLREAAEKASGS